MRSPTTAKSVMRPKCTSAQVRGFQLGPSAPVRIGRAFDEAIKMLTRKGQEFNDYAMHTCKGARFSIRPWFARAHGR